MSKLKRGKYKHFKGMLYRILDIAKHSETLEEMVVYEALYENTEGRLWVRPRKMFEEEVLVAGKKTKRFTYIGKK